MEGGPPDVRLLGLVREDAFGVWVRGERAGAPVVLRTLHDRLASRDDARLLLAEEVRRIAGLAHPFLLRTLAHDSRAARPWALTEPIDGETLEDRVARGPPLPAGDAWDLARSLAGALDHLAARRQVHAAPIPSRIVRVGDGWRLLTFRDVRAADEARLLKGRAPDPRFAAPETDASSAEPVRAGALAAWAVGALLRFASGGGPPRGEDGAVRPLATADDALAAALARLLDPDPKGRPDTPWKVLAADPGRSDARPRPGAAPVPRRRRT